MKHFYSTLLLVFTICYYANAAPKYWVGPQNGNWNNAANWSGTSNGAGGVGVPAALDSVIFSSGTAALVRMDVSSTIASLTINRNTVLFTSAPITLRILNSLSILQTIMLKDSTDADVSFNIVFDGASKATASIYGDLVFEGGVPLNNPDNSGAGLVAESGSLVSVLSRGNGTESNPNSFNPYQGIQGGQLIFKKNSGRVISTLTSLYFGPNADYQAQSNLDIVIPVASWAKDKFTQPEYSGFLHAPAAFVALKGTIDKVKYAQSALSCGRFVIDLPDLPADKDLGIPDGSLIDGSMEVYNTNNRTLTLLANSSAGSSVSATVGSSDYNSRTSNFLITGSSKVALARASDTDPGKSFNLIVWGRFSQSGGNFSLQDYEGATGFSNLEVHSDFTQTAGTFYTNSTSMQGKFALTMSSPPYITGPSGSLQSLRTITASSGTIDNNTHNVTLRNEHQVYLINGYEKNPNGIALGSPLQVGKLELVRSPITTTATNILTVNNPSPDAVKLGGVSTGNGISGVNVTCYVNGPLRRVTNSTQPYFFPTGKGNYYVTGVDVPTFNNSFYFDSCYVIPTSSAPSVYQAEYFRTGYPDANVTAPLVGISNSECWDFAKVSGSDAQVKMKLRSPVIATASSSTLVAAHYENGHWVAVQGSTILPCAITDSFIVSKPMSDFSPFTLGYLADGSTPSVPSERTPGLNYKFYQGNFTSLPDFNSLTPVTSGSSNNVDISVRPAGSDYNYAFKWDGYITISTPGAYTFETVSDDGSKIYFNAPYCLNAAALVSNDGIHGATSVMGNINITAAGTYPITVTYFQNYSGQSIQLYWSGPGFTRQLIPNTVFTKGSGTTTPPPQTGTGLNYKYYEGSFNVLPNFAALTPVKTGTTPNVDISVRTAGVNDNFAFTWDGAITIPTTGTYTFETVSDDGSKLSFNGNVLVNNDGLHAPTSATGNVTIAAGTYPISISFFEKDGGESMQVYWTGPGISRQLIPDAAFGSGTVTPPTTGSGLNYKYYEGDFNVLPSFASLAPVKTGNSANADISVRNAGVNDHFAFVWEGTVNLPAAGTYTFETVSDDGSRIVFNGNTLVNNDGLHAPTSATGIVTVAAAGAYPITISYFEKDGGETMQLYWSGPGIARQLIPDAAFGSGTTPPAVNTSGLNYKYYEGDFNVLPDYSTLTPVKTGTSANVDISVRTPGMNDHFAFIWSGYINLPTAGTYTFETISDDGSKMYFNAPYSVNAASTVNNDGLHAPNSVSGMVTVASAGRYPISITFFEKDGGETMQLYWSGPGISRQLIPDAAFTTTNNADGVVTMSESQTINLSSMSDKTATKIYPNPFVESFTVDYYAGIDKNKVNIGLYDLNGKLVYSYEPSNLATGNNRWLINMGSKNLLPGVYMAQIKVNGVPVKSIKLIKAKR